MNLEEKKLTNPEEKKVSGGGEYEKGAYVITDNCVHCLQCYDYCPVQAIDDSTWYACTIRQDLCIRCGFCQPVCPTGAIIVIQ